jgi:hypothetical protein
MSVEQTTQLMQLILNSLLAVVGCALLSNRLAARYTTIEAQFQSLTRHYADLLTVASEIRSEQLVQTKKQLRHLRYRQQIMHYSVVAVHGALLLVIASAFLLSLRALLPIEALISLSLGLFAIAIATLLVSVGLTLIDLQSSQRSLREDVGELLSLGRTDELARANTRLRQARPSARSNDHSRHENRFKPPLRARVG